jgi:hypothetical protein
LLGAYLLSGTRASLPPSPSPPRHVQLIERISWIRSRRCERRSLYSSYTSSASTLFKRATLFLLEHHRRIFFWCGFSLFVGNFLARSVNWWEVCFLFLNISRHIFLFHFSCKGKATTLLVAKYGFRS